MKQPISRRSFTTLASGIVILGAGELAAQEKAKKDESRKSNATPPAKGKSTPRLPVEAQFKRDYAPPGFNPRWERPQINRTMLQDFVIFAHQDLDMVKKLVSREPMLVNGLVDWGGGDWESGLGGATHMGRRDIVEFLLASGARIDIFCAAFMGQLDAIRGFLALQSKLIDARGPHGINLHEHAYIGGKNSEKVYDFLQSVKKVEMRPMAKTFRKLAEGGGMKDMKSSGGKKMDAKDSGKKPDDKGPSSK